MAITSLPQWLIPRQIEISSVANPVRIPRKVGAIAGRSVREPVTLNFDGRLVSDTADTMRTSLTDLYNFIENPNGFNYYYNPNRWIKCYLDTSNYEPKWPAVSDTFIEISFTVICPTSLWTNGHLFFGTP